MLHTWVTEDEAVLHTWVTEDEAGVIIAKRYCKAETSICGSRILENHKWL